jgi:hypothetical protein
MPAKVAGMDHTSHLLSVRNRLHLHIVGPGLEEEPVCSRALCVWLAPGADRQGKGVPLPLSGDGLPIGGELAAHAIRVRDQEGCADSEAHQAIRIIVLDNHSGRRSRPWRGEDVDASFAGEIPHDLKNLHAPAGSDRDAREFRHAFVGHGPVQRDHALATDLDGCLRFCQRRKETRHHRSQCQSTKEELHRGPIPGGASNSLEALSGG